MLISFDIGISPLCIITEVVEVILVLFHSSVPFVLLPFLFPLLPDCLVLGRYLFIILLEHFLVLLLVDDVPVIREKKRRQ
jgi:hypothetical protein